MADALDSKSSFPKGSVGSSPTFGTGLMHDESNAIVMDTVGWERARGITLA
jgi:hypothetical protein